MAPRQFIDEGVFRAAPKPALVPLTQPGPLCPASIVNICPRNPSNVNPCAPSDCRPACPHGPGDGAASFFELRVALDPDVARAAGDGGVFPSPATALINGE